MIGFTTSWRVSLSKSITPGTLGLPSLLRGVTRLWNWKKYSSGKGLREFSTELARGGT
jgi:hypothetical protein